MTERMIMHIKGPLLNNPQNGPIEREKERARERASEREREYSIIIGMSWPFK